MLIGIEDDFTHPEQPKPFLENARRWMIRFFRGKWNCRNWRGKPVVSHQVIVGPIAATTSGKGLKVHAQPDAALYPAGIEVFDQERALVNLQHDQVRGE
jgi:hypothetical protein